MTDGSEPTRDLRMDHTREMPMVPEQPGYRTGQARVPQQPRRVPPSAVPPTHRASAMRERPTAQPLGTRMRRLRLGGRWTVAGLVVLAIGWGLWAYTGGREGIQYALTVLGVVLAVGVGLFGVSRLLGAIVLERIMHRVRRTAVFSHVLVFIYLTAAGLGIVRQIEWVIRGWNHLRGIR